MQHRLKHSEVPRRSPSGPGVQLAACTACKHSMGTPATVNALCSLLGGTSNTQPLTGSPPPLYRRRICRVSHLHAARPFDDVPQREVTSDMQTGIPCPQLDSLNGCCDSCIPARHSRYTLLRSALHVQPQQGCLPAASPGYPGVSETIVLAESSAQQPLQEDHTQRACWAVRRAQLLIDGCLRTTWPTSPAAGTPAVHAAPVPVTHRTSASQGPACAEGFPKAARQLLTHKRGQEQRKQCAPAHAHVPQHECQTLTPAPPLRPVTALRPGERGPGLPERWAAAPPVGERGRAGSAAAVAGVGCSRALWPTGRPAGPAQPGSCRRHHWSRRLQPHQRSVCVSAAEGSRAAVLCSNQLPAVEAVGCTHLGMCLAFSRQTSS